ncbi:diguanylate cyclase/phosphodiesterase (plasmid) [Deinococcus proteolyticus MRP]|uniref:Diguanylate cyclase/phosphodiesterase n=1 Tax=Deinococcus proteolyticus (strain ATCC 35074 / DSM 20540 / JCM 6276 / NBRC 101906 / NCIMB 13154 / VKM Ac-1939 / CCM 2703 / MRP) TaxID=693977 RepID=F0RPK2_DEIPM|nr:EAL domain-containing protein [Deinococcus proteolyticus]ADY27308.1 diguanylate cyclase/phosphodiesterase [Deinococcus proteolyticus MRP]
MSGIDSASGSPLSGETRYLQELLQRTELLLVSDVQQAETLLRESLALAQRLGDKAREAQATMLLGAASAFRSEFHTARELLHRAEALAQELGEGPLAARIANNLGVCDVATGNYGQGMEWYQRSLRIAREANDDVGRARALNNIGLIYLDLADYQLALETYQETMAISSGQDEAMRIIHSAATVNIVRLHEHLGEFNQGLQLALDTLPRMQQLGYLHQAMILQIWMLPCLIGLGRAVQAAQQAEELLPAIRQMHDPEHSIYTHIFYGKSLMQLGRGAEAQLQFELAVEQGREHNVMPLQYKALSCLSELYAAQKQWQLAYTTAVACQGLTHTLQDQTIKRKAQVLGVQLQLEFLRREEEAEQSRISALTHVNKQLQTAQHTLAYRATHDALTGLANRAYFQAEVERELEAGHSFGLLFIDLDRFKQVNDTLGHDTGDQLLKAVARQLKQVLRPNDLVARMGGDEFTVILRNLHTSYDAEVMAHKVLNRLAEPFHVAENTLYVTASIGMAVAPQDGEDVSTLQRHADIAMYRAKREGKNSVRAFQPLMGIEAAERVSTERDLRLALTQRHLVLHYQSQFDAQSGRLTGFEALVRWQHPTHGLLYPGKFIEIAEDSGLIVPMGEWVLNEACRQAAVWGANGQGFTVSVNVSALQFMDPVFLLKVQAALDSSGLKPECLILELTESVLLENRERALKQLTHLRDIGVRLALDDFGTGYSSLGLLQHLQGDILKIDSSFVRGGQIDVAGPGRALIEFLISLAHSLGMCVIAEGVETEEQYQALRSLDCDRIQGFLLGRPEPAELIEKRLNMVEPRTHEEILET